MNPLNHFLTNLNVLLLVGFSGISIFEMVVFALIFGVVLDLNQIVGAMIKKPINHRRTWVEEPFGIIILGLPLGFLLYFIEPNYLPITIISYACHIGLDYLTIHEVSPFSPFFDKKIKTGVFKSFPRAAWFKGNKGISENYVTLLNIILLAVAL